jgi:hypothetical protein
MLRTKRRKAALVVSLLALVAVSAAIAAWITWSVSGSGGSRFGQPAAETITLTANVGAVGTPVTPGSDGDIGFDAVNSSSSPAHLTSISFASPPTASNCTLQPGDLTINDSVVTAANLLIPPGSTTDLKILGALHGSASLPLACAGGTITIPLTGTAGP